MSGPRPDLTVPRHAAFLRGINLGRRRVKMADLRAHFEEMALGNVESFIASGNVVFDHPGTDLPGLEQDIERHLESALGFTTEAFVRGMTDLSRLAKVTEAAGPEVTEAAGPEGPMGRIYEGFNVHVIFLRDDPADAAREGTGEDAGAGVGADSGESVGTDAAGELGMNLRALESPDDRFHLLGREVLWLRRGRLSVSPISTRDVERALGGMKNTMRSIKTVRRMVEKFGEG